MKRADYFKASVCFQLDLVFYLYLEHDLLVSISW